MFTDTLVPGNMILRYQGPEIQYQMIIIRHAPDLEQELSAVLQELVSVPQPEFVAICRQVAWKSILTVWYAWLCEETNFLEFDTATFRWLPFSSN